MKTPQAPINSGFSFISTATDVAAGIDLIDKVVVITGGHSGIGLETTRVLSENGATVVVGARDIEKAAQALVKVKNVEILALDLSRPPSIDQFCQKTLAAHPKIDILINNAGVMAMPETRDERGFEMQFATNHLGHFQLTARLLYALKAEGGGRVVTLTSAGHRFAPVDLEDVNFTTHPYDKWKAYGQSKTANSLFAVELDRRMQELGVRSFAVHPGRIVSTALMRHMEEAEFVAASNASPALAKSVAQGAATTVWAATSPQLANRGGVYCADCEIAPLVTDVTKHPAGVLQYAVDDEIAKALWDLSEKMTARPKSKPVTAR
jgi:NAD(P)-dependent dehydrogenase (short-subunit alcohol dehydrogenase family)